MRLKWLDKENSLVKIQRNLFLLPCRPKFTVPSQFFLEQYNPRTLNLKKIRMKLDSNLNAAHVWRPGYFFSFSCWYFCPVHRWCIRCSMFSFTQKCFISVICTMIYARHLLCSWFARCGGTAVIFSAVAVFLWKSWT